MLAHVLLLAALQVTLPARPATDAPAPVTLGQAWTLHSEVLDESRAVNVLLPPGYDEGDGAFPVVYLLDGAVDEDFVHVAGLVRFLETYELMPRSILVGIANTDRTRDMTCPWDDDGARENAPTAGGSAAFRRFLGEELVPWVQAEFRTAGPSTLIGQSLAGYLATEVFVQDPGLFDQYVIVSPSLWWNDFALVEAIAPALVADPDRAGFVCLVVGDEGPDMEGPVHAFAAALARHAPDSLGWEFVGLPEETHATILHRGLYRAFEVLYGEAYPGM